MGSNNSMFSTNQKRIIAIHIEKLLLSFDHPEMPRVRPNFRLHVDGAEPWSWADIDPNWKFESKPPGQNPWNEAMAKSVNGEQ